MTNQELITSFYTAFSRGDAEGMIRCYAPDVEFEDPAFGKLHGKRAADMWRMLVSPDARIVFGEVWTEGNTGGAHWEARYRFSKTGREVWNRIDAVFEFRNGKIIRHKDHFSFYRWARQALGTPGLLLGWSRMLRNKVRQQALERLAQFEQNHSGS